MSYQLNSVALNFLTDWLEKHSSVFYIDGAWIEPVQGRAFDVVNPATEEKITTISLGSKADVDLAVAAAKAAFPSFSATSIEQRLNLLANIAEVYEKYSDVMAAVITAELGSPIDLSRDGHTAVGGAHIQDFIETLKEHNFEQSISPKYKVLKEPIGVCGLITPWNWPINQIALKVLPALAAGCSIVLKPSELTPLSALLFAHILDESGVPNGVFNLVNGDGPVTGASMSKHPDIAMISFTGSTSAGIAVLQDSATTVKRVALELGGKSPNIIFKGVNLPEVINTSVMSCFENSGQSCDAPTRMLVEQSIYEDAVELAGQVANAISVADPTEPGDHIGPVISNVQFDRIQGVIQAGIDEGARLIAGGKGKPDGFTKGHYVKPTIFADVSNDMRIAQEEIFGPVIVIIPFKDEEEAVRIANDSPYGLSSYIQCADKEKADRVGRKLRAGMVRINGAPIPDAAPFGGYKLSGIGREGGHHGLDEYLEIKTVSEV